MINEETSKELTPKIKHITLTREELLDAAKSRISLITKEFQDGFNFISNYTKSVTFFGSARVDENNEFYKKASSVAEKIVKELGYAVVTGGSGGVMEGANRGAFEAKGQSIGLGIKLPYEQKLNKYLTDSLDFYYFFSRKVCLSFSAEAYIFLPGGFGTLDEFFEILTLVQTKKIEKVPIILVGSIFWKPFDEIIKREIINRELADEEDTWLYAITDNEEEIIDIIKRAPIRDGLKFYNKEGQSDLSKKKCVPCEGGTLPVDGKYAEEMMIKIPNWTLSKDHKKITKIITFDDFGEAMIFVNEVGSIAERENHHPDIHLINYNEVLIDLTTHAIGGLSENDFILASKIDNISIN